MSTAIDDLVAPRSYSYNALKFIKDIGNNVAFHIFGYFGAKMRQSID